MLVANFFAWLEDERQSKVTYASGEVRLEENVLALEVAMGHGHLYIQVSYRTQLLM